MSIPIYTRFWGKVEKSINGCWEWRATKNCKGYGMFSIKKPDGSRTKVVAHRFAYEDFHGIVIPEGMQLDHVCRNRGCVNPLHLEVVTNRENILRGVGLCAKNIRKSFCDHGHEFTKENTKRFGPDGRWRRCKACKANDQRKRRAKKKLLRG